MANFYSQTRQMKKKFKSENKTQKADTETQKKENNGVALSKQRTDFVTLTVCPWKSKPDDSKTPWKVENK